VVFWAVAPCRWVVGNNRFGGRSVSIFKVEVRDHGDVSTAMLPKQRDS
jgi:hypothetical protein